MICCTGTSTISRNWNISKLFNDVLWPLPAALMRDVLEYISHFLLRDQLENFADLPPITCLMVTSCFTTECHQTIQQYFSVVWGPRLFSPLRCMSSLSASLMISLTAHSSLVQSRISCTAPTDHDQQMPELTHVLSLTWERCAERTTERSEERRCVLTRTGNRP